MIDLSSAPPSQNGILVIRNLDQFKINVIVARMTTPTRTTDTQSCRAELQNAGLKVTSPRLAVLSALNAHPHSDADTVYRIVAKGLPTTSLQAVYGVLGAFTDAGIVRRIEPAGSSALYERRAGDNHHHLICTSCRSVTDIDCVIGATPCLTAADSYGFSIHTAEVTFWGLCPTCQSA